jgi:cytochrome c-type biogenesis protein CcmH
MKVKRWLPYLVMAAIVGGAFLLGPRPAAHRNAIERARDIAAGVRCPTCGGESALESQAPISQAIRAEIERRIGAGESDGQIRSYLVSRYGRSILLKPPTSGVSGVVWVLPVLALAGAAVGIGLGMRRWQARAGSAHPSEDDLALVETARRAPAPAKGRAGAVPAELEEQRAFVLGSLADLDRERAEGVVDDASYAALRDDATARAARLLREVQALEAVKGGRSRTPAPRKRIRLPAVAVGAALLVGAGLFVVSGAGPRHSGQTATGSVGLSTADPLGQARQLAQQGKNAEALSRYNQVLARDPRQPEALAYRGLLLAMGGQTDLGMTSIERAIAADPTYPDAHFIRGLMLAQQGDRATAAAELRATLAFNPPPAMATAVQDALSTLNTP